jgi:hypothetical protein
MADRGRSGPRFPTSFASFCNGLSTQYPSAENLVEFLEPAIRLAIPVDLGCSRVRRHRDSSSASESSRTRLRANGILGMTLTRSHQELPHLVSARQSLQAPFIAGVVRA